MNFEQMDFLKLSAVIQYTSEMKEHETRHYNGNRMGKVNRYELIFVVEGECKVQYQNVILRDFPNTVRFLPPRMRSETYHITSLKDGSVRYIEIFFHTNAPMPKEACCTDYSQNIRIGQLFSQICNVWQKKDVGYYKRSLALFHEILYEMQVTDEKNDISAHTAKIEKGVDYLHAHYTDVDFEYGKLSEASGISYTYFKRLFKESYGLSPSEYVKNLRMKRAREWLRSSYASIAEIALACGYNDIYYFSKVFKEENHCSPSEYRRLNR